MRRLTNLFLSTAVFFALAWLPVLAGESPPQQSTPTTRAGELSAERDAKATKDIQLAKPERVYYSILKNPFVKGFLASENGLSVTFGGLVPGSSFAMGLNYAKRGMLDDTLDVTMFAAGSVKLYYSTGMIVSMPHLAADRIQVDYLLRRDYAPQMQYYGPGNRSKDENRTNYMLEDFVNSFRAGFKPFRQYVFVGAVGTFQQVNVGPGTSDSSPSTETIFGPIQTPGIDKQAHYAAVGPFLDLDYTDDSSNPHSGGRYTARYLWYHDSKFDQYSFRKVQVRAEQYVPFLNKKRTLAFRAASEWNLVDSGQRVPFFLQAKLGGPNDLRGYRQFRFYDDNSLLFNGEYRYEVASGMDLALFSDWGKVFHEPGHLKLSDMRGTAGFGVRWRSRGPNMIRFDVGFGPQGVNFWFSFNDIFQSSLHSLLY